MNSTELPQPFAGAITLLEAIATHGSQASFEDGTATPNAKLCERFARELREYARTALASQASKGAGVVEGWALVPKEPTQEMKDEIIGCCTDDKLLTARYRAMLRAAPSPAQAQPVAYADPQAFKNFDRVRAGEVMPAAASHEWMWARPSNGLVPMYLGAQPVADAAPMLADQPDSDFRKCLRAFAMTVAEEGIKEGRGRTMSVASDRCRAVVDGVMGWEIGKGLIYDLLLAAQRDLAQPSTAQGDALSQQALALEQAAQACDQQADGTNGPYRSACLQCADAVRALRDIALAAKPAETKS